MPSSPTRPDEAILGAVTAQRAGQSPVRGPAGDPGVRLDVPAEVRLDGVPVGRERSLQIDPGDRRRPASRVPAPVEPGIGHRQLEPAGRPGSVLALDIPGGLDRPEPCRVGSLLRIRARGDQVPWPFASPEIAQRASCRSGGDAPRPARREPRRPPSSTAQGHRDASRETVAPPSPGRWTLPLKTRPGPAPCRRPASCPSTTFHSTGRGSRGMSSRISARSARKGSASAGSRNRSRPPVDLDEESDDRGARG